MGAEEGEGGLLGDVEGVAPADREGEDEEVGLAVEEPVGVGPGVGATHSVPGAAVLPPHGTLKLRKYQHAGASDTTPMRAGAVTVPGAQDRVTVDRRAFPGVAHPVATSPPVTRTDP